MTETTYHWIFAKFRLTMASLVKTTVQNLTRYRNVFTPVIARSFAFRKLEIDPVGSFEYNSYTVAC